MRRLRQHQSTTAISVVTWQELMSGVCRLPRGRRRESLERYHELVRTSFPMLAFDEAAAERYGVQRAAVRDRRRDAFDRLIAAHATSLGLTLVTNNEADFRDYPGLIVENWV